MPSNRDKQPDNADTPDHGLSDSDQAEGSTRHRPDLQRSTDEPQPIELEQPEDATAQPPPDHSLSEFSCPHCGAPMPGEETVVCLRCGFDLHAMEHRTTVTEPTGQSAEQTETMLEEEQLAPISAPGRGGLWLPATLAVVTASILVIGFLAGARGLFITMSIDETITWPIRLVELLRFMINAILAGGCIAGALVFVAYVEERPVGRWDLLFARLAGIVFTMRLAMFIDVPDWTAVEWMIEACIRLVVFIGLSHVLFAIRWSRSALVAGIAVLLYVIVRVLAWSIA